MGAYTIVLLVLASTFGGTISQSAMPPNNM